MQGEVGTASWILIDGVFPAAPSTRIGIGGGGGQGSKSREKFTRLPSGWGGKRGEEGVWLQKAANALLNESTSSRKSTNAEGNYHKACVCHNHMPTTLSCCILNNQVTVENSVQLHGYLWDCHQVEEQKYQTQSTQSESKCYVNSPCPAYKSCLHLRRVTTRAASREEVHWPHCSWQSL